MYFLGEVLALRGRIRDAPEAEDTGGTAEWRSGCSLFDYVLNVFLKFFVPLKRIEIIICL